MLKYNIMFHVDIENVSSKCHFITSDPDIKPHQTLSNLNSMRLNTYPSPRRISIAVYGQLRWRNILSASAKCVTEWYAAAVTTDGREPLFLNPVPYLRSQDIMKESDQERTDS